MPSESRKDNSEAKFGKVRLALPLREMDRDFEQLVQD